MSEQEFPRRVTLGEDGVYRWTYDMDMRRNLYLFKFVLKIMLWCCLGCDILILMLAGFSNAGVLWLILGLTGLMLGIWVIAYAIWGAVRHWNYRMRFEMTDESVAYIPTQEEKDRNTTISVLSLILSLASRRYVPSTAAAAANNPARSRFKAVRGLKQFRENDVIAVRMLISGNRIYVPDEDYDFVLEYISSRVPEAARENRGRSWPRRLTLSCLASLAVNGIAFAVNYLSFRKDQSLPLSVTMDAGGAVEQRAFGMRAYRFIANPDGEGSVDFFYDAGLALVGFIFVALAFFLIFSVSHWARKKTQG